MAEERMDTARPSSVEDAGARWSVDGDDVYNGKDDNDASNDDNNDDDDTDDDDDDDDDNEDDGDDDTCGKRRSKGEGRIGRGLRMKPTSQGR
jgi:hypothetical protein